MQRLLYIVPISILLVIPFISAARQLPEVGWTAVPTGEVLGNSTMCPNLYRNLSFGMAGSDVRELQTFLIAKGDLATGYNTGYFGNLTRNAVGTFQCREMGICSGSETTTGWGRVGPATRAKIQQVCGGTAYAQSGYYSQGSYGSQVSLSASPTSGNAPLSVMFRSPLSLSENVNAYSIDYGDGVTEKMNRNGTLCPAIYPSNCTGGKTESMFALHRYASSGTYTARLLKSNSPYVCAEDTTCPPPPPVWIEPTVVGTVTISVWASNSCQSDVDAAVNGSSGTACTAQTMKMRCPHDRTFMYSASNGCQISTLQNRGWTEVTQSSACKVSGCSGTVCISASAEEVYTTCEYRPSYGCYQQHGICEVQSGGNCGWTSTEHLNQCIANAGN